jgi:hypothetical protein
MAKRFSDFQQFRCSLLGGFFFFFFFSGLPHWRNGQACRIDPYPSVHEDSEEAVLAAKS